MRRNAIESDHAIESGLAIVAEIGSGTDCDVVDGTASWKPTSPPAPRSGFL